MKGFSNTTQYALLALVFFVVSLGVAVFSYYYVGKEGTDLETQMETVGKSQLLQERYNDLNVIAEASAAEHEQLKSYLLTEGDTIGFLNTIEMMAKDLQLEFTTDSLEVAPLPNPHFETITLRLRAVGTRGAITRFLNILETLPYYSRIDGLNLEQQTDGADEWLANITLVVGLQAYDQ